MKHEITFRCPLPHGLHARPASLLAELTRPFSAAVLLVNERTGGAANARSVLALIGLDIKHEDACRLDITGDDAADLHAALERFIADALPRCDDAAPAEAQAGGAIAWPRLLRGDVGLHVVGTTVCPGVGRGAVVVADAPHCAAADPTDAACDPARERERVSAAVEQVRAALQARLGALRKGSDEAGILSAHLAMATDAELGTKVESLLVAGRSAPRAITEAAEAFAATLRAAESVYIRERAADVHDICEQLLEQLDGARPAPTQIRLTRPSIIVAAHLAPRQLLTCDRNLIAGLVLENVGATSHVAILARSFGVPTLTGVANVRTRLRDGDDAIVDANLGVAFVSPPDAVRRYYDREIAALQRRHDRTLRFARGPATTRDGTHVEIAANVSSGHEAAAALAGGADGVGLFRTEMLFLDRDLPPTEDEQFTAYAQAVQAAGGKPVVIRTFDIGADKPAPYLNLPAEANPFLGCRGARVYARQPELLRAQLRAMLRASAAGPVWIMIPMVATPDEVRWLRAQVAAVSDQLRGNGVAFNEQTPIGIMIEIPAVAHQMEALSQVADFFSIGTNDLAQYFFAVDRDNPHVAGLHDVRSPAFLRLLQSITSAAHRHNRWIGLCGEMGRDLANLPLLIGLGLNEISVGPPAIAPLKEWASQLWAADCRDLLSRALAAAATGDVDALLAEFRAGASTRPLIDEDLVLLDLDSANPDEAIHDLVGALFSAGRTDTRSAVEDAIWAREATYSTNFGHGFAIPHCKTDAVQANSIAVARFRTPIAWKGEHNEDVRCAILLAIRETGAAQAHMRVLAALARRLMHEDFRAALLGAPNAAAVVAFLRGELGLDATNHLSEGPVGPAIG